MTLLHESQRQRAGHILEVVFLLNDALLTLPGDVCVVVGHLLRMAHRVIAGGEVINLWHTDTAHQHRHTETIQQRRWRSQSQLKLPKSISGTAVYL